MTEERYLKIQDLLNKIGQGLNWSAPKGGESCAGTVTRAQAEDWYAEAVNAMDDLRLEMEREGIADNKVDILTEVLRQYYRSHEQIDNGQCAECRVAKRLYVDGVAGPCANQDCISHVVTAALAEGVDASVDRILAKAPKTFADLQSREFQIKNMGDSIP